ncbi:peptidoglycan-binding protein [Rhodoligotrophos ferricapiens]|uniref:peptidoglycan-binding protein n=1 Tax=Rhodoligotrophos ferricapiens TaxID=3069264 RepID=UPI00315DB968
MTPSGFWRSWFLSAGIGVVAALGAGLITSLHAQENKQPISNDGALIISGFSGTSAKSAGFFRSGTDLNQTMIDLDGGSVKVFDLSNTGGAADAQLIKRSPALSVPARKIGQVFGLALDDAEAPNIYAAASSAFGLQLIGKGENDTQRIKTGQPDAAWMPGQFGEGGGPGSIWRIDGRTGQVTLFADISDGDAPNSGPGLGDIAFDADHQQFFVSDFDTGLIHALDISGKMLGRFDHGATGRKAAGLSPVADDGRRADITSSAFDSEDPESWGFTPVERRVWGLAYHEGRLYYAVWSGPEIWSVGITDSGGFADDARRELGLSPEPKPYPVSSIAFDGEGRLYLAQRGEIRSRYDYGTFALPRKSRVLRYVRANDGSWSPEPLEYPIGFPATHQNASGGLTLGPGYKPDGSLDADSCWGTLWVTGDGLRESSRDADRLQRGGPLVVHGAQGLPVALTRADNLPPFKSYYLDYDDRFDDPNVAGHVGDIAAVQHCASATAVAAASEQTSPSSGEQDQGKSTGETPEQDAAATDAGKDKDTALVDQFGNPITPRETEPQLPNAAKPSGEPDTAAQEAPAPPAPAAGAATLPAPFDLSIAVRGGVEACAPTYACPFTLVISNNGPGTYRGPLTIAEEVDTAVADLADWSPRRWSCERRETTFVCTHAALQLRPGESVSLRVDFVPWRVPAARVQNCARLLWQGSTLSARNLLVQESLSRLGFDPGPVDGLAGARTRSAIQAFAAEEGQPSDGQINDALLGRLFGSWGNGDLRSQDDRDCASLPLRRSRGSVAVAPDCGPTDLLLKGRCVSRASLCDGGRQFQASDNSCTCPQAAPLWDPVNGRCTGYAPPQRALRKPLPSTASPSPSATSQDRAQERESGTAVRPEESEDATATTDGEPSAAPDESPPTPGGAQQAPQPKPDPTAIVCPGNQRWDDASKQCKCPPDNPVWDKISNSCIPSAGKSSETELTPSAGEAPKPNLQICSGDRVWSNDEAACICPPERPNWDEAAGRCTI